MQHPHQNPHDDLAHPALVHLSAAPKVSIWRKWGGGSLTVSILIHAVALLLGVFWVFRVIHEPAKPKGFVPTGDVGGSPRGAQHEVQKKKQLAMISASPKRIVCGDSQVHLTLPPQDDSFGDMNQLVSLSGSGLSGGIDGSGGIAGMGIGQNMGANVLSNAPLTKWFGMPGSDSNRLVGSIYDLHQTKDGKANKNPQQPANADGTAWVRPIVTSFIENGWRDEKLEAYFKGPAVLGVPQILIPKSLATAAPEAFGAGDKMQGGAWVAVYRGRVTAPESAEIRFLGSADNFIALRWDRRNILAFDCGRKPSETENIGLRMPMAKGEWIKVNKGSTYDVAVLIGDAGGLFSACLYYEKKNEPGKRFLFRTELSDFESVLATDAGDMPKKFELSSPAWSCKPSPDPF